MIVPFLDASMPGGLAGTFESGQLPPSGGLGSGWR